MSSMTVMICVQKISKFVYNSYNILKQHCAKVQTRIATVLPPIRNATNTNTNTKQGCCSLQNLAQTDTAALKLGTYMEKGHFHISSMINIMCQHRKVLQVDQR